MPYASGFQLMSLNSWSPTSNPTEATDMHAEKKAIDIVTLTATITQHWQIAASDKSCTLTWKNMSKTDKDALLALYEASYTSYVFVDWYGTSHNVVISSMQPPIRIDTIDQGFEVSITLKKV